MARVSGSGWQGRGVRLLYEAAGCFGPVDQAPAKADGRRWIRAFVQLRNRTLGHGAPPPAALSAACGPLESAIREFTTGFGIFSGCEWVHLRRNLSGKYNVARLTATSASFDHLRSAPTEALANGVYVWVGGPVRVELVECRPDVPDFFIANGNFTDRSFEALSYATGATVSCDAGPYQAPVGPLPPSETAGATSLEVQGQCLGNLPALPAGFVARASLQEELYQRLTEDNHPIITLHGRGGTGKTSLALEVLHRIAREGLFDLVLWFSARDLDLLPEGPKRVAPEVLDVRQLAEEFARLLGGDGGDPERALAGQLRGTQARTLITVDNFETASMPGDLYRWIDAHVRGPNKVLVTTRHRAFRGDFPVEVGGMTADECEALIGSVSARLGISGLLTAPYRRELVEQSGGHPYAVKILLGEVAKPKRLRKIERVFESSDEVLGALFERTFGTLSPLAQRLFLTISAASGPVPLVALGAVLLRRTVEPVAFDEAIRELSRSSFVDLDEAGEAGPLFASLPFVARAYGRQKLQISALKDDVAGDAELLRQLFGTVRPSETARGVMPALERLFSEASRRISAGGDLGYILPVLEFAAARYRPAWVWLAELHLQCGSPGGSTGAKGALLRGLTGASPAEALPMWRMLAELARGAGEAQEEIQALAEICDSPSAGLGEVSGAANRFNRLLVDFKGSLPSEVTRGFAARIARSMRSRCQSGGPSATDLSRLAWVLIHAGDKDAAADCAQRGLAKEPGNEHCLRVGARLGVGAFSSQQGS